MVVELSKADEASVACAELELGPLLEVYSDVVAASVEMKVDVGISVDTELDVSKLEAIVDWLAEADKLGEAVAKELPSWVEVEISDDDR